MQSKGSLLLLLGTLHSNRDINNNTRKKKKKKNHHHHFKKFHIPLHLQLPPPPVLLLKDQPGIIKTVPLADPLFRTSVSITQFTGNSRGSGFLTPNCDSAGCGSSDLHTNRRGLGNHFDVISATFAFRTLCMTYQRLIWGLVAPGIQTSFSKAWLGALRKGGVCVCVCVGGAHCNCVCILRNV